MLQVVKRPWVRSRPQFPFYQIVMLLISSQFSKFQHSWLVMSNLISSHPVSYVCITLTYWLHSQTDMRFSYLSCPVLQPHQNHLTGCCWCTEVSSILHARSCIHSTSMLHVSSACWDHASLLIYCLCYLGPEFIYAAMRNDDTGNCYCGKSRFVKSKQQISAEECAGRSLFINPEILFVYKLNVEDQGMICYRFRYISF